jgi:hypothetical protein
MANILGLINAESFAANRFNDHRRQVFYFYPNGSAPLMGLLSLLRDEATNDPTFYWYEKRLSENWTTAANISTTVVWYKTITVVSGKVTAGVAQTADFGMTAGTQYAIKVAASPEQKFRIGHIFRFSAVNTSGTAEEVVGRVNAINTASDSITNTIGFTAVRATTTNIDYDNSAHSGTQVTVIGSAYAEGIRDESSGIYNEPISPYNYTQIFRRPFTITGTALKTASKFDEQGVYPDQSKEASVDFMRELEWAFLFGERAQVGAAATSITRYTGGLLYFLRLWEAGTTYGNTAATADTDDTKRIIENTATTVTMNQLEGWLERIFRISNNKTNEKLALCGSGALLTLNRLVKNSVMAISEVPLSDSYGMDLKKLVSPWGTLYLKTHPLMSQNSTLRYNMLVVDVPNVKYRYLTGRDMELLTNRQNNDEDARKDEWLAECGAEYNMIESHMYIKNLIQAL